MSNIHKVLIKGTIPYDGGDSGSKEREEFISLLLVWGLRFTWGRRSHSAPTKWRGELSHYHFELQGEEGVRWEHLKYVVKTIQAIGGVVETIVAKDIENRTSWYDIRTEEQVKAPD